MSARARAARPPGRGRARVRPRRCRRALDAARRRRSAARSASVATLLVLLVGFGAIVVRLVEVQALGGEEYTAFGVSQRFQDITLPADRGSIFDRNGYDLAVSLPQQTVWANPR